MPYIELKVEQLFLDHENPRLGGGVQSQREAIQRILDDQKEKLAALAESIAEDGLSPIDPLLVLQPTAKEPDKYIVLEGNRRVAALKLLANPTQLSGVQIDQALKKRFERIAAGGRSNKVKSITCYVIAKREDSRLWLFLRHTGENGGKGLTKWSAMATSAFRGVDPALQALDFVLKHGNLSDEQKQAIDERFPLTTLDRLLSSKEVRQLLGIDIKDKKLETSLPLEELIKPLRRIVLDLVQKVIKVDDVKSKQQQVDYINKLDDSSKPDKTKSGPVKKVEEYIDSTPPTSAPPARGRNPATKPSPVNRKTLVPRTSKLNVQDAKVAAIYKELRRLKVEEFPHAVAVLLRVFLELSVDHLLEKKGGSTKFTQNGQQKDKTLQKKVEEGVDLLVNDGANRKDFAAIMRGLSVPSSPLHIDLLHSYVHNRFSIPRDRDLLAAWDEAARFFDNIWI